MEQLMTEESVERYLNGEINWAQMSGLSMDQAYGIAELGYNLLTQGRLKDAETIFVGLVEMNPSDGYFRGVLGSIWARQGKSELALEAFNQAVSLGSKDPLVFVNRAEILLSFGRLDQALADLKHVLEQEQNPAKPAHIRAKAMAAHVAQAIQLACAQKDA